MTHPRVFNPEDTVFCGSSNHRVKVKDAKLISTNHQKRWICLECLARREKHKKGNKHGSP